MSVVELHPEDLLDRDVLSAAEAERLERHLVQCVTCRLEHRARRDFRDEDESADGGEAEFDVQRLLSEVLAPGTDRELMRVHTVPQVSAHVSGRRSVRRRLRPLLLVAAALLVAGVSAAAGWKGIHVIQAASAPEDAAAPSLAAPPALAASHPLVSAARMAPVPSPVPSVIDEPVAVTVVAPPVLAALPVPSVAAVSTVVVRPPGSSLPSGAWGAGSVVPSINPPPEALAASAPQPAPLVMPEEAEASVLFERANRARRSGDRPRAEEIYRGLIERYPGSQESHEARAVLGRELLGEGDASGAVRYFDGYLKEGGALAEDVAADRATALGRLGRSHDEADAWKALLVTYPGSVHATRARGRLRELGEM